MKKKKDFESLGDSEENVYGEQAREELVEGGEISPEEEGFMAGYDEASEDEEEEDEKDEKSKDKSDDEEEKS